MQADKKKKESMSMWKIILIVNLAVYILSFVIPSGAYQRDGKMAVPGTYEVVEKTYLNPVDVILAVGDTVYSSFGKLFVTLIIMGGMIFNVLSMGINAAQRGAGNTKIALRTNMVSNLVNVVFNYLLIGGNFGFPALGTRGAALATVIGSVLGCAMSLHSMFAKSSFVYIRGVKGFFTSRFDVRSLLNVGSSAFVEQIFLRIGFLLFAITVANLGTTAYAAHQIGMNMMSLTFSLGDGLSVASVALIGRSLGEERRDLAKLYASMCQRIGLFCAFVMSMVFLFFGRNLYGLFSSEQEILDMGVMIMRMLCVIIYLQITQVIFFGCLRGAGDTKYTAFASMISVAIIRPGLSWLLCYPLGLGLLGVWLGLFGDQFMRFCLGYFRMKQGKWLKIKI